MTWITIITRHPEACQDYYGFGWKEVERGKTKFDDHVIIIFGPAKHADWQAGRLNSGLHGARVMNSEEELIAWKEEWGFTPTASVSFFPMPLREDSTNETD